MKDKPKIVFTTVNKLICPICKSESLSLSKSNNFENQAYSNGISMIVECKNKHVIEMLLVNFDEITQISFRHVNGKIEYYDYIKTEPWKSLSNELKIRAGMRCQLCNKLGNLGNLHAHHRTYENLGNEKEGDVIILCSDCHAKFHNKE